jgi:hypothetical protein
VKNSRKIVKTKKKNVRFNPKLTKTVKDWLRNLELKCFKRPTNYYKTTLKYSTPSQRTASFPILIY